MIQGKCFEDIKVGEIIWLDGQMLGFVCEKKEDTNDVFIARTPYGRDKGYPTNVKVIRRENTHLGYTPRWYGY